MEFDKYYKTFLWLLMFMLHSEKARFFLFILLIHFINKKAHMYAFYISHKQHT